RPSGDECDAAGRAGRVAAASVELIDLRFVLQCQHHPLAAWHVEFPDAFDRKFRHGMLLWGSEGILRGSSYEPQTQTTQISTEGNLRKSASSAFHCAVKRQFSIFTFSLPFISSMAVFGAGGESAG